MGKKIREFVNKEGQRYVVKEEIGGELIVDFIPFSMRIKDWSFIDEMKAKGAIEYTHRYEQIDWQGGES